MGYKPGDTFVAMFTTSSPTTDEPVNADSTPVATAYRNGVADGAFALTVTNVATGLYKATGTVPMGYADGDSIQVVATATITTRPFQGVVDRAVIDYADTSGTTAVLDSIAASQTAGTVATTDGTVTAFTVAGLAQSADYTGLQVVLRAGLNAKTRRTITGQSNVGGNIRLTVSPRFASAPVQGEAVVVI